ncbi:MAG: DUF2505 domain-containing protein [Pseudomonadota bacterium]
MKHQHEDRYPLSAEDMYRVFCDRAFYEARYAKGGRYEFVEFGARGNQFIVDVRQFIALRSDTKIPALARRFVRDENVLRTTIRWNLEPDAGGERRGTHSFRIEGVPVEIDGTMRLVPVSGGCVNHIALDIRCTIPLIGGTVAAMLGERAGRTLARNQESTNRYLRERGLIPA